MTACFHTFIIRLRLTPCHNHVPVRIPPIASKDSLDEASSPSVVQSLRTGSLPLASAPCLNRVQTSNKAHDKFVPLRDCACADHSRPSLSAALLSGWSSHLHNHVPFRIPPIASKDSLDEASSPSVVQSLRTGSLPLASAPCLNRVQTSNKAHDKFVPLRDCACADHSRPSLSAALLSGWSSHLTFPSSSSTTIIVRKSRRCLNCRNP